MDITEVSALVPVRNPVKSSVDLPSQEFSYLFSIVDGINSFSALSKLYNIHLDVLVNGIIPLVAQRFVIFESENDQKSFVEFAHIEDSENESPSPSNLTIDQPSLNNPSAELTTAPASSDNNDDYDYSVLLDDSAAEEAQEDAISDDQQMEIEHGEAEEADVEDESIEEPSTPTIETPPEKPKEQLTSQTRSDAEAKEMPGAFHPHEEGRWDIQSLITMINQIYRQRKTCRLRLFKDASTKRSLFFQDGNIANIFSVPFRPKECLGRILQRARQIEQSDVVKSLEPRFSGEQNSLQGEELIKMGKLNPKILQDVLFFQIDLKFSAVMEWKSGTYDLIELRKLPNWLPKIEARTPRVLLNLLWKHGPEQTIDDLFIEEKDRWIGKNLDSPYEQSDFRFGKKFDQFWNKVLEKDLEMKRLMVVSNFNPPRTKRIVWVLSCLEMIQFMDETREDLTASRIFELTELLKIMDGMNHFDVLQVHWTSKDDGLLRGYKKIRSYYEKKKSRTESEMERDLISQVLKKIDYAYEEIKEYQTRKKYREETYEDTFIEFNAGIFRQKGESYLFTKDEYLQAIEELESALEILESDGEVFVVLGLAQFLHGMMKDRQLKERGRSLLMKGYNMVKNTEIANLCMGMMYKKEGQKEKAKNYYQTMLKINPNSRFAKIELHELATGRTSEDREKVIRDFLDSRSVADKKFEEMMKKKSAPAPA